jgi:hypothetical protein
MSVSVAFPFVTVVTDTSALRPAVQRAPGVLAVVGPAGTAAQGGSVAADTPTRVADGEEAATFFSSTSRGTTSSNPLYDALKLALIQTPAPNTVYGVRVGEGGFASALAALEAADDVTIVALAGVHPERTAGETDPFAAAALTALVALKDHVETMSAAGNKRIGVAMIDPSFPRSNTYTDDLNTGAGSLASSRIVLIAARGAVGDAGVAAAAAMAGYPPSVSMVLKQVNGVALPLAGQFGPGEIRALSEKGFVPLIDPALISGETLHLAEGRTFKPGDPLQYIDTVRTLDDIEFRLKAGLIGLVGDARITRSGLITLKARIEGILGVVQREQAIDGFRIQIPVLDILSIPEDARTPADRKTVKDARDTRAVAVLLEVTLGPATHRVDVQLFVN